MTWPFSIFFRSINSIPRQATRVMSEQKIKLRSADGEIFDVELTVIKQSIMIKTMLEDLRVNDENLIIPLDNVTSLTLKKVLQWAFHHKDDSFQLDNYENRDRTTDLSKWDEEFFNVDQGTLFELLLAANYLDMRGLLDTTCKAIANMIKGKSPEEIRRTFKIEDDSMSQEEEQIDRENERCQEK